MPAFDFIYGHATGAAERPEISAPHDYAIFGWQSYHAQVLLLLSFLLILPLPLPFAAFDAFPCY